MITGIVEVDGIRDIANLIDMVEGDVVVVMPLRANLTDARSWVNVWLPHRQFEMHAQLAMANELTWVHFTKGLSLPEVRKYAGLNLSLVIVVKAARVEAYENHERANVLKGIEFLQSRIRPPL